MKGVAGRRIRGGIAGGFCESLRVCGFGILGGSEGDSIGRKRDGYKLGCGREARLKGDVDLVGCAGAACIGALGFGWGVGIKYLS